MDDVDGFISIRMILGSSRARSNHQTMCCGQSHGGSTRIITLPIAQQQTLAESRAPPAATKYVKIREDAPIWKRKNNTEMDLDSGIGNRFPDDGNFQRNGVSAKDCWQKQRVARERASERAGERARRAHPPQWSRKPYGKSPALPKPYPNIRYSCLWSCWCLCLCLCFCDFICFCSCLP